ncbi:hypothetical protein FSARC_5036 [Fusarium sarcochroum]|uniref:Uncharacterized protein n=1 Tax=Fusarium sarcochroum TaxID=1208366 RepID=A0A8H4X9Y4_9HYPO|nr:hypothetical protein FSARC_5036 [Fusarium sarcochroum]
MHLEEVLRLSDDLDRRRAECLTRGHGPGPGPYRPTKFAGARLSLDTILQHQDSCFHVKEGVSLRRSWCNETPLVFEVETSRSFHKAFSDERTLPISHSALQERKKCLPPTGDGSVDICLECRGSFDREKLPKAYSVNNMNIGYAIECELQGIEINLDEIRDWQYAEVSAVPAVLMELMQREESSAVDKTHTDPIAPNTDADQSGSVSLMLKRFSPPFNQMQAAIPDRWPIARSADRGDDNVCETPASGMLFQDGPAVFTEPFKLPFLTEVLMTSQNKQDDDARPSGMMVNTAGDQSFIQVECSADFTDNLHKDFVSRTFPKLFL